MYLHKGVIVYAIYIKYKISLWISQIRIVVISLRIIIFETALEC